MVKTTNESDKFMLRLPDGMRERIKKAADEHGRTMNAEIVQALEQIYPVEPTLEEVIGKACLFIDRIKENPNVPYRQVLIDSLNQLLDRITSGLEFDQDTINTHHYSKTEASVERLTRWHKMQKYGVEQRDLMNELKSGFLHHFGKEKTLVALFQLKSNVPDMAMKTLSLNNVKFAEPDKAYQAIEKDLNDYYKSKWGEPVFNGLHLDEI